MSEDLVQTDAPLATELSGHQNFDTQAMNLVRKWTRLQAEQTDGMILHEWWARQLAGIIASALRSAVEAEREAASPKWQPIETAPKDGAPLLLWWKYCPYASVGSYVHLDDVADDVLAEGWMCEDDDCIPINQHDCTHWMHLPSAPSLSDDSAITLAREAARKDIAA